MQLIEIGRTTKSHGYAGHLKILLNEEVKAFLEMETLFLLEGGKHLPYFVEETGKIKDNTIILKIEDIDSKEAAHGLLNKTVFADEQNVELEQKTTEQPLLGWKVVDANAGELGLIEDIVEMPQQQMAQLTSQGQEILVPIVEEYIENQDEQQKILQVNLPEGLIELNQ